MTDTTFTPDLKKFAIIGLPADQDRSSVPRAELIFTVSSGSVLDPGPGNAQRVLITPLMPAGFSYSIQEAYISVKGLEVDSWQTTGWVIVNTGALLGTTVRIEIPSAPTSLYSDGAQFNIGYVWKNVFPGNLLMPSDTGASATFKVSNIVDDKAAATIQFMCRVLQYDIEQAHHYQVNTPILTR